MQFPAPGLEKNISLIWHVSYGKFYFLNFEDRFLMNDMQIIRLNFIVTKYFFNTFFNSFISEKFKKETYCSESNRKI